MTPPRVLHLLPCLYRGGAEMAVRRLVLAMGPEGHRMAAPDGPGAALFDGVLPRRAFRRVEADLLTGAASLRRALAAEAAEAPPDIVHVHGEAGLLWFAARALPGAARVYTSHGIVGAARIKAVLTAWAANRWAHRVTVASAHDAARLRAAGARGVVVVPNAVPAPEGAADPALRGGAGFVAGALARLEPEKGVDVLIRAAALAAREVPGLRVVVAGEGGQRRRLERLIAATAAPVVLAGYRPAGAVLGALDAYVQPSRAEAFGMAALEAMAAGVPVVASEVGGLPEALGGAGVLVPTGDPAALAAALVALARDPARRAAMGRAGAARAAAFAPAAVAAAMGAVYAEARAESR